jgi:hypothetical protein
MISIIFARSGGPPAAALITSADSRKCCGPIAAGYHDARRTLRHSDVLKRPDNDEGFFTFDLAVDGRE